MVNNYQKVLTYPNSILRVKSSPITEFDDRMATVVRDMITTMYGENGLGLSAIQIGVPDNMFVMNPAVFNLIDKEGNLVKESPMKLLLFINPIILEYSKEYDMLDEGCLSFPNVFVKVRRARKIVLSADSIDGIPYVKSFEGLAAQVIQHENDHLTGKLLIDDLSELKKKFALKRMSREIQTLSS